VRPGATVSEAGIRERTRCAGERRYQLEPAPPPLDEPPPNPDEPDELDEPDEYELDDDDSDGRVSADV
jgi:hypothetical protein